VGNEKVVKRKEKLVHKAVLPMEFLPLILDRSQLPLG